MIKFKHYESIEARLPKKKRTFKKRFLGNHSVPRKHDPKLTLILDHCNYIIIWGKTLEELKKKFQDKYEHGEFNIWLKRYQLEPEYFLSHILQILTTDAESYNKKVKLENLK